MLNIDNFSYNNNSEQIVELLVKKTQNNNPLFFRILTAYYFSMMASMMRVSIKTHDRGKIPVNMYAINLNASGTGKGHSTNIIENEVIQLFRKRFINETFEHAASENINLLAAKRAARSGAFVENEKGKLKTEYKNSGALLFSFDSATAPAVKQYRHKLLLAEAGALNLQIDEIGSNLLGNIEALTLFLELYDVGLTKQKLVKNTAENTRVQDIEGRTPANMLLFGTPVKLLDGGKTEEEFFSMLETGYARRCLFGYATQADKDLQLTAAEVYDKLTNKANDQFITNFSQYVEQLADPANLHRVLDISKNTTLELLEYKLQCEREAATYPEHEEVRKAELSHRYFKALKLAGAYAFIDNSNEVMLQHLHEAIKLVEASGRAFSSLLQRDKPYVKLAKYIASCGKDLTQADLVEDLPYYKGPSSHKADLMNLAIAYGYRNNIIIKKDYLDGIEFISGESLEETDLNKCIVSYSNEISINYRNDSAPFDDLYKMTSAPGIHWANHHFFDGHRADADTKKGFNLLVLDVDEGTDLETVKFLMKDFTYMYYTTKRHTNQENRFRFILPINYVLELDTNDYKELMEGIYDWLPFKVDTATKDRCRKWLSNPNGHYGYNHGTLVDILPFIPKTSKNDARKADLSMYTNLDNLERWMLNNSGSGNRNNMLLRYALLLFDIGNDFETIRQKIFSLNSKMDSPISEAEIMSTIMITISKKIGANSK